MTDAIRYTLTVPLQPSEAFALFTERLAQWWPHEYTWGQGVLEDIGVESRPDGLCYERGPHGFRCDWGRVLIWQPPSRLTLAWQISPRREPEPNAARASTVELRFDAEADGHERHSGIVISTATEKEWKDIAQRSRRSKAGRIS